MPRLRPFLLLLVATLLLGACKRTDATLQVDGHRVTSEPLGLSLQLDDQQWSMVGPEDDFDFVAIHERSRAVLTGKVHRTDPPDATLDQQLDDLVEARREHWGEISQVQRRDTSLGELPAKGVGYGAPRDNGVVPVIVAMAHHGPWTVQFTCVGTAPARTACERALGGLVLPAP